MFVFVGLCFRSVQWAMVLYAPQDYRHELNSNRFVDESEIKIKWKMRYVEEDEWGTNQLEMRQGCIPGDGRWEKWGPKPKQNKSSTKLYLILLRSKRKVRGLNRKVLLVVVVA